MSWLTLIFSKENKALEVARTKDTPGAYKWFLWRFPESAHFDVGKKRLEELVFDATTQRDTIEGYRQFLLQYPDGGCTEDAKMRISEIEAERLVIQDAVHRILSSNVQANVKFSESKAGCILHISAHLLNAYSPEDAGPTVKGAYGSHSGLYRYVKRRIAQIYRTVFTTSQSLRFEEVVVECRHGVRYVVVGGAGSGDYAMTLYTVALKGKNASRFDWANITDEAMQTAWKVRKDIIPSLQFQHG